MTSVSRILVQIDVACDYVPFASTFTNLVDLFQKYVFVPCARTPRTPYYEYLNQKTFFRCVVLLIPVLGNLWVYLADVRREIRELKALNKTMTLILVVNDWRALELIDPTIEGYRDVVLEAVAQNGLALQFAKNGLDGDKEVVSIAVVQNGLALQFAKNGLDGDKEVVSIAVAQNGLALQFAKNGLNGDEEVVSIAVENDVEALGFASEEIRGNEEKIILWTTACAKAFKFATQALRENYLFTAKIMNVNGLAFEFVEEIFQDKCALVTAALVQSKDKAVLRFAAKALREDKDLQFLAENPKYLSSSPPA